MFFDGTRMVWVELSDTWTTTTILKKGIARGDLQSTRVVFKSATWKSAKTYESRTITYRILVANITENVILGIYVMTKLELPADLKRRCPKVANEEIFLYDRREERSRHRNRRSASS